MDLKGTVAGENVLTVLWGKKIDHKIPMNLLFHQM